MKSKNVSIICAIIAACLYAINVPFSKLLLDYINPTMMAAFLYLGAGIGLFYMAFLKKYSKRTLKENR